MSTATATAAAKRYTVAEYLALERASETKHEFLDGRIWPLGEPPEEVGNSQRHDSISRNTANRLRKALRATPFDLVSNADVECPIRNLEHADICVMLSQEPVVIIEVLSPETEANDRGEKFEHYQSLPSLKEYVLIAQDRPRVEHYVHQPEADHWLLTIVTESAGRVAFPVLKCDVALAEVYRNVESSGVEQQAT